MKIRLFLVFCTWLALAAPGFAGSVRAEDVFPGENWEKVVSPEKVGWSQQKLEAADAYAQTIQTTAYLIVQGGLIVHEYGRTTAAINVHSMRKSILSLLIGIYSDRGPALLSRSLEDLGIDDKDRLSAKEKQATVQQLLQGRSGVYHPAAYEGPGASATRPARGSYSPGEHWFYSNWDANVLGTIFGKIAGKTVFEGLRDDLAKPLQFENFSYCPDTQFRYESESEHPAYIMRLWARDLARVGLLMSRGGRWKDRRIVSGEWVAESVRPHSETDIPQTGYGYMWWVDLRHKSFSARGYKGQVMIVSPAHDLIFVHLVDTEDGPGREVFGNQFSELLQRITGARLTGD